MTDIEREYLAPTRGGHRAHPQTACTVDEFKKSLLRRGWGTTGSSQDLYQCRQAADLLVYLLRASFRECYHFVHSREATLGYT